MLIEHGVRVVLNNDYDNDPNGHLIYWDCVRGKYPILEPARPITDPDMVIAKIGQQNMLPGHLRFRGNDIKPILITTETSRPIDTVPPGISAFLFFGEFHNPADSFKDIAAQMFNKAMHRKSRIHIAQVGDINRAGWTVYYAPMIDRKYASYSPLHVILTPNSMLPDQYGSDASDREKATLARTFIRWYY